MTHDDARPSGTILLAATPIGDPGDASPRLVAALASADVIAAEDTRRLRSLASRLGAAPTGRVVALHDHNEQAKASGLVRSARDGATVLLVSDAGMPTVSDPGYRVVTEAIAQGVPVSAIPGPSAPLTALALSGLPSDRFAFEGFVPRKAGEAERFLGALATDPRTLIFFESPRRVHETLVRMAGAFGGGRAGAVCRELTKTHEEVIRGTLDELVERTEGGVLGEVTIVVAGHKGGENPEDHAAAVLALADEGMRLKDAAAEVAAATGLRRNDLYRAALAAREWGVLGAGRGDRGAWRQPWRPGNGECSALAVAIEGVVTVLGSRAGKRSPQWGAAGVVLRAMPCSWRGSRSLGGRSGCSACGAGFQREVPPLGRAQWAVLQAKRSSQRDTVALQVL